MNRLEKGLMTTAFLFLGLLSYYSIKSHSTSPSNQHEQVQENSGLNYHGERKDYRNLNKNVKTKKFKFKNKHSKNTQSNFKSQKIIHHSDNEFAAAEQESGAEKVADSTEAKEDKNAEESADENEEEPKYNVSGRGTGANELKNSDVLNSGNDSKTDKNSMTTGFTSFSSTVEEPEESDSANSPSSSGNILNNRNESEENDPEVTPSVFSNLEELLLESEFGEALDLLENTTTHQEKIESFKILTRFALALDTNNAPEVQLLTQNFYYREENVVFMTAAMISDDFTFAEKEHTANLIFNSIDQVLLDTPAESFAQVYFNSVRALLPSQDKTDSKELNNLYMNLDLAVVNKYNDLSGVEQIAGN